MSLNPGVPTSGIAAPDEDSGIANLFASTRAPFRDLFNSLPFPVIYLDRHERYRFVNRAYETWAQRTRSEVMGRHAREVLGEALYGEVRPYMVRALEGQQIEFDIELKRPTEAARHLTIRYVPDKDAAGQVRGVLVHLSDMTTQRQQEVRLREQQIRFRTIVEGSAFAILETDDKGKVLYTNSQFRRMTGVSVGFCFEGDWTCAIHPSDCEQFRERWTSALAEGAPLTCEIRIGASDSSRWVSFQSWPLVSDFGISHIAAIQDISARKQSEERMNEHTRALQSANRRLEMQRRELLDANANLQRLRAQAEAATRIKSDFLANMSHEIRTPMTAILGFTDMLCESMPGALSSDKAEALRAIRRNGEHLLELINDILDVSKIEAGRMMVERIAFSPIEVLEEVVAILKPRARQKHISLAIERAAEVPDTIVSDPTRFRQILINLIGNAIKFTDVGCVRVAVSIDSADAAEAAPRMLCVDVIDSGIGIDRDKLGEIFEPFSQADTSTTRRFGGTGLGLTISRRLATLLGGSLTAESNPGAGSAFRLRIDIASSAATPEHDRANSPTQRLQGSTETMLKSLRILVAEDGPDNQRLILHVLRKAGAHATVVENGELACDAAIQAWRAGMPYDVVLMDMQMPVMDGYAAVRRLRAEGYDLPIVALTAHAMSDDREKCLAAGTDEYDTKPIDRQRLIGLIRRVLRPRVQEARH